MKIEGLPRVDEISEVRPIGEFGSLRLAMIPRNRINILPQIRQEFDQEKLQELAESIANKGRDPVTGRIRFDMMEPLIEGYHTTESAAVYIEQYNHTNGTSVRLEDLIAYNTPEGVRYVIHIAGERRLLAGDMLIEQNGLTDDSEFLCHLYDNIEYIDALPMQFKENNARVNPPPRDEAHAIRKYYDAMKRIDPSYTKVACADAFAVRPDKIADSIIYTDYPSSMQALGDHYPFSWLIAAKEVYDIWLEYYKDNQTYLKPSTVDVELFDDFADGHEPTDGGTWTATDGRMYFSSPEEVAAYEVETCFNRIEAERLLRRQNPNRKPVDVRLKTQAEQIRRSLAYEDMGIGEFALPGIDEDEDYDDEGNAKRPDYFYRRIKASTGLFEAAFKAIMGLERRGELRPSMRERLAVYALLVPVDAINSEDIALEDASFARSAG